MNSFSIFMIPFFWLFGFYLLWKIPQLESTQNQKFNASILSVIIPARNEAMNLETLLNSLHVQSIKIGEVMVVNDHSQDTTADVATNAGCVVVDSKPLPEGWVGKTWACWQGALQAKGEIILFLDADTRLQSDGIQRLLATYHQKDGLLSVQPYHHMEKCYERLAALFNIITMAGMNAFTFFGDKIKPIGAFGPCIICRKSDYFKVGGHQVVRGEILESLGLGRAFLKANLPVRCYGGKGLISFRMYPDGFKSMVEGFSKGFGLGAKATTFIGQVFIFCWIYAGINLTRHLLQAAFEGNIQNLLLFLALDSLYIFQIHWMLSRIGNFRLITAILFQVPLIFFVLVFFLSMFKTFILRRATWKGRAFTTKKG